MLKEPQALELGQIQGRQQVEVVGVEERVRSSRLLDDSRQDEPGDRHHGAPGGALQALVRVGFRILSAPWFSISHRLVHLIAQGRYALLWRFPLVCIEQAIGQKSTILVCTGR